MLKVICQICNQRPATSHLLQIDPTDGATTELHICNHCQKAHDLDLRETPPDIGDFLAVATPAATGGTVVSAADDDADQPVCSDCGMTWSRFASGNRFGCATCATTFRSRLDPALDEIHGARQHVGRLPEDRDAEPRQARMARRMQLEHALAKAVAEEAFERAATLRDELQRLDEEPA